MTIPSEPRAAIPTSSWLGRDVIDLLAAIGLAAALTLLLRSRPSPLQLSPYFVLVPLVFGPLLRRSRRQRVGFVVLAGTTAAIFLNLSPLR